MSFITDIIVTVICSRLCWVKFLVSLCVCLYEKVKTTDEKLMQLVMSMRYDEP